MTSGPLLGPEICLKIYAFFICIELEKGFSETLFKNKKITVNLKFVIFCCLESEQ